MVLTACVSVAPPAAPTSTSERVVSKNYEIGQPLTATVGETIVRVKDYQVTTTTRAVVRATQNAAIRSGLSRFNVFPDQDLPIVGERTIGEARFKLALLQDGATALHVRDDGSIYEHTAVRSPSGWVQVIPKVQIDPVDTRFLPVISTASQQAPGDQNYEIVFTGTDGQAMRFQYREYTANDLARPAFSQDLSYPATSKSIRFRKLAIAVDALTADQLTYRVTQDQ